MLFRECQNLNGLRRSTSPVHGRNLILPHPGLGHIRRRLGGSARFEPECADRGVLFCGYFGGGGVGLGYMVGVDFCTRHGDGGGGFVAFGDALCGTGSRGGGCYWEGFWGFDVVAVAV